MPIVSVFPSLLSWSEYAPMLIRLTLAAVLIFWAFREIKSANSNKKIVAVIEALAGILLIIGLWTQVAALVIVVDLIVRLLGKLRERALLTNGVNYYLILLILAVSLLLSGPGEFSIDYPL